MGMGGKSKGGMHQNKNILYGLWYYCFGPFTQDYNRKGQTLKGVLMVWYYKTNMI